MNYLKKSIKESIKLKKKLQNFESHINRFSQKGICYLCNKNKQKRNF